ncbi:hypothetical protein Bca52824_035298 [Brassica carinata]|uniref:Uncharacterized protein n=1 Tax=Brassica carinata TaxID=52824 RepID=A0A8X7S3E0_BRACI|nr:hypothetical protein Bca52824_035298 [Brassica carinata]
MSTTNAASSMSRSSASAMSSSNHDSTSTSQRLPPPQPSTSPPPPNTLPPTPNSEPSQPPLETHSFPGLTFVMSSATSRSPQPNLGVGIASTTTIGQLAGEAQLGACIARRKATVTRGTKKSKSFRKDKEAAGVSRQVETDGANPTVVLPIQMDGTNVETGPPIAQLDPTEVRVDGAGR